MASARVYSGSNMTVLLPKESLPCSSEVLEPFWIPSSSPVFHDSKTMIDFENARGEHKTDGSFYQSLNKGENGDEEFDGCFHQPEKKRRLTVDQVQFLERYFETENKLEPERKVQLAKELGLQPRQIAIWFQNRRARYKTKQLEKDYDSLKASYDSLKADYECLIMEKEKLKTEVLLLKDKLLSRHKERANAGLCDPIDPMLSPEPVKTIPDTASENETILPMVACKQEDAASAKSDVSDSDSPHYTDENHSDFSQDEEDNLSKCLLPPPLFPKLEDCCSDYPPANSCNFGFPVEDQPLWFWPY